MPLQQDQTIRDGKYRIIDQIGEGGMARVWLAEELTFGGRQVAIKEPRDDLLPTDLFDLQRRYAQEVKVCAALEKARVPHIVRAITAEPYGDSVLLVLEYMPGGDLAGLVREHPHGLPEDRVLAITRDLLAALEHVHAHELEIVHRDIKPSNVLFDANGRAYLGDFGLAQVAGASGRSQLHGDHHPGTALYMPPEQAASADYLTPSADLYALGCVLFEMWTGKRFKRVRPGTRVSQLRNDLPDWAEEVVSRLLMDDPWDRYQEAAEIVDEIGLAGRGTFRREGKKPPRGAFRSPAEQSTVEASRRRVDARVQKLVEVRESAESARSAKRWEEARDLARAWLDLEPQSTRAAEILAQAVSMSELAVLPHTSDGVVIATPENIADLLALSAPPERIWWEKAAMEMCLVPAGEFAMGSGDEDPEASGDERPFHRVHLSAYYLGRCAVTNAQYERFVQATGHRVPFVNADWGRAYNWDASRKSPPFGKDNHPVVLVSWDDAGAYCHWAGLRLPSEAEWEKAARGTDARRYPWGNGRPVPDLCNFGGKVGGTTEARRFSPQGDSPYGCADMSGNVWEWVHDWYAPTYYGHAPQHDPTMPDSGSDRVLRGGSWVSTSQTIRSTNRNWANPGNRDVLFGFRCARGS